MKSSQNSILTYILLVLAQILICNFINTGPYVFLTLLPVLILCLPLSIPSIPLMLIAAVSGLAVDWLAEGVTGLNMAAAVPVAFIRNPVARVLFGEDQMERGEGFSFRKNGILKISAAILICTSVFLAIYIFLDSAGTRTFLFNLLRFAISLSCGYILAIPVINLLTSGEKK